MGTRARLKLAIREIKMRNYSFSMATIVKFFRTPAALAVISCVILSGAPLVHADSSSLQQEIANLDAQNAQASSSLSSLELQASSYQDAISNLQAQINGVQAAINTNEAEQASLQQQIQADQAKITQQKQLLSQDIESMYVDGQMTTLEMLATSSNLSSFVNAEEYKGAVQDKLQGLLTQIAQLENQLEIQQTQVGELISSQEKQQVQLSGDESQQNSLLSMNQSQQTTYNQQIQNNDSQVVQLQAQLEAQLQSLGGYTISVGTGSYPWASAPCLISNPDPASTCGDYDWGYPAGASVPDGAPTGPYDPWGYEYRNCTSYVAWKLVSVSTNPAVESQLVYDLGNAAQWPSNVPQAWVSSTPQPGDAAVLGDVADGQGHVMFVESVNGDGTINVSEYNYVPGSYSEQDDISTSGLIFIHFPDIPTTPNL